LTYRWKHGIETAKELAEEIKVSKPDFVHVAVQTGEWERDSFFGDGISLALVIRQATGIPVIANGGFHNVEKAEVALKDNHATPVTIGKAALAAHNRVMKTMNGLPFIPFPREMLWPEATLSHTRKSVKELNLENS